MESRLSEVIERLERIEKLIEGLVGSEGEDKREEKTEGKMEGHQKEIYDAISKRYNLEVNDDFASRHGIIGINWVIYNRKTINFEIVNAKEIVERCGIVGGEYGMSGMSIYREVERVMRDCGFVSKSRRFGERSREKRIGFRVAFVG